jgi:hypothetical protein
MKKLFYLFSDRKNDLEIKDLSHLTQEEILELLERTRRELFKPAKIYGDAQIYDDADV